MTRRNFLKLLVITTVSAVVSNISIPVVKKHPEVKNLVKRTGNYAVDASEYLARDRQLVAMMSV